MELKEFITTTLVEIHHGVRDAIETLEGNPNTGSINPIASRDGELTSPQINAAKSNVDFDIAVTTTNEDSSGVNGGIKVMGVSVGGSGNTSATDSYVTRIKFSIPCIPPSTLIAPASQLPTSRRR